MTKHRAYETAAVAAVDTWYALAEALGVAQVMVVPEGVSRISKMKSVVASDGVGVGAGVILARIQGDGVDGLHHFILGGSGGTLITSDIQTTNPYEVEVNIPVTPGGAILIEAGMNLDVGMVSVGIELSYD